MILEGISDIHTHCPGASSDAVINLDAGMEMLPGHMYSVGVHPWLSDAPDVDELWSRVQTLARHPQVVVIGECGIDKKRGAATYVQMELLRRHAALAEEVGKPLLLHVVGAFPEVIGLRRQIKPVQPWIVHGFRGKPQLADELLRHGFDISLGELFNPLTPKVIPPDRLYVETDTSSLDIAQIRSMIDKARYINKSTFEN